MREPGTVQWLVASIVLSVVLTLLLNVALRAFPDAGRRLGDLLAERASRVDDDARTNGSRVRVFAPWKAMILVSALLTILVNLVFRIT